MESKFLVVSETMTLFGSPNNGDSPRNSNCVKPFLSLVLQVWDEKKMAADEFLGLVRVPLVDLSDRKSVQVCFSFLPRYYCSSPCSLLLRNIWFLDNA